jgi:hypothetical protein
LLFRPEEAAAPWLSVGVALVSAEDKAWSEVGHYALQVAMECGSKDAALWLCHIEDRFKSRAAPTKARTILKQLADEGENWIAMTLYIEHLVDRYGKIKLREAYDLAHNLVAVVKPEDTRIENPTPEDIDCYAPPKTLEKVARLLGHREGVQQAVRIHALEYGDPDALEKLSRSHDVKPYSDEWVHLLTLAGERGNTSAADQVGKYYLVLKGWYPPTGRAPTDADDYVGFDWLKVAANGCEPADVAEIYWALAMLCRWNGRFQEGRAYLKDGEEAIMTGVGNDDEKEESIRRMRTCYRDWEDERLFRNRPAVWLENPPMPNRQEVFEALDTSSSP